LKNHWNPVLSKKLERGEFIPSGAVNFLSSVDAKGLATTAAAFALQLAEALRVGTLLSQ
jgi:hypothetical protein